MKPLNNFRNSYNSFNTFNPSSASKLINFRKNNGINPKKFEDNSSFFHRNKNINFLKAQNILYNSSNDSKHKILKNVDSSNDIKIQNNNSTHKNSLSTNNTNTNYYSKRRSHLYKNKNIKTIESETTQSRNVNKYNGNSLSRTTWSSFSFTEGTNNINQLINGYDYEKSMKNKIQILKNENDDLNKNELNAPKFNDYNLNKYKENGIKYCIDMDGNPMSILDIKLKNKNPIAFIIQKQNRNILVDLDNKIINPNNNGDYILPQKPYFIIRKYDVQYPELRINNTNNNYISINVNDSNESIHKNKNILINRDKNFKRKNNKSCNIYNFSNGEEPNKFYTKINKNFLQNKINSLNNSNLIKINSHNKFKDSLRDKKRKYIFVNKLANNKKSIQLNINTDNSFNSINQFLKSNITFKNKNKFNSFINHNDNKKNDSSKIIENNTNNFKLFINNLNKFKNRANKLKDIKCFTHKEIKNLEFNFERKYKNYNTTQPSLLTKCKLQKGEETPKEKNKYNEKNIPIKSENTNHKNDFDSNNDNEIQSTIKKKYIIEKINNLDLKKYKKKRCSFSLNQFMYNNMKKTNFSTLHNMLSTLNTFNNSFISPTTETTTYTTIKNLHREVDKEKKFPILGKNETNIKKLNSFKYYLKPKIKSQKVFHKRIKTEDMNRGEKKFRFFKFMNGNDNNTNNSIIKPFYCTESDFTINNCKHNLSNSVGKEININNNINNNVCKCPYCNHFFYN